MANKTRPGMTPSQIKEMEDTQTYGEVKKPKTTTEIGGGWTGKIKDKLTSGKIFEGIKDKKGLQKEEGFKYELFGGKQKDLLLEGDSSMPLVDPNTPKTMPAIKDLKDKPKTLTAEDFTTTVGDSPKGGTIDISKGGQVTQTPDGGTPTTTYSTEGGVTKVDGRDWELGDAELDIYNTLTKEQKDAFWLKRDELAKGQTDYAKDLNDFLTKEKGNKEYLESQREKKTRIDELTGEILEIQSSERINNAKQQVKNLKTNIAYIGTMGAPGVSSQKLDAVSDQITQADETYANMRTVEDKIKQARELGLEMDVERFEKQMSDLQDNLDSQVNGAIQQAFNQMVAADANGKLDTIEDIQGFKDKVLANMDKEIAGITDNNFQQRKFLIDEANTNINNANKKIAEYQKQYAEYQTNKNKFTVHPAGYYIDGNGDTVVSAVTGKPIRSESAEKPLWSGVQDGKFVSITKDANGNLVSEMVPIMDEASFSTSTIQSVLDSVQRGNLTVEQAADLFPQVVQTEAFAEGLANMQIQTPEEKMTPYQQAQIELDRLKFEASQNEGALTEYQKGQLKLAQDRLDFEKQKEGASAILGGTADVSRNIDLVNKYSKEASFKNNNPTGITFNAASETLKKMWTDAGVKYGQGTARPSGEGGNYVGFETVEDGLKAYEIALTQRGDDVYNRLVKWVGTKEGPTYASKLMSESGIQKGAKFSELSDEQLNTLMANQIKKESPGFYNEIISKQPVDTTTGKPISETPTTKEYTPNEKLILDDYIKDKNDKDNIRAMNQAGLGTTDVNAYIADKESKGDPEQEKLVSSIGQNILKGRSKMSDIAGDPELREKVQLYMANNEPIYTENDSKIKRLQKGYDTLAEIVDWEEGGTGFFGDDTDNETLIEDISGRLQTNPLDSLTGEKQHLLRQIQFILDAQVLEKLIEVKGEGATFGSLSNDELQMLQKSASPLNSAALRDDDGNITGFKMSEEKMKSELRSTMEEFKNKKEALLNPKKEGSKPAQQSNGRVKNPVQGGRIK